ncbi:mechanosensitive ion channel protein 10-like [Silene latifolia]|uniref:mechanosensitive ion channel protein 10-like n=1 Tax=Silene latifolia TaxID=37657 RepID=UPI003D786A5A
MANLQTVEREMEVDDIFPENQPEIPPSQNTVTNSVTVRVEKPVSSTEEPTTNSSVQAKCRAFLTGYVSISKLFCYLFRCLFYLCLAPVVYACITVVTVAFLPLLVAAFVVVRLNQLFIKDKDLKKNFLLKFLLGCCIFVAVILLLLEIGVFYVVIAKNVTSLKLVTIIGLPIVNWIKIICTLIGIYLMSQIVSLLIVYVIGKVNVCDDESSFILLDAASEIFGCLLFLWANVVVMNSVPTFKRGKILGIYIQKWVEVALYILIGYNLITLLTRMLVWSLEKVFAENSVIGKKLTKMVSVVCCEDLRKGAFKKKYVVYVAIGIMGNIVTILSLLMLLLIWVLYFGHHLDKTSENKRILEIGKWTLVSILICSFLWLIKSCIVLFWEARTVYDRLHSKLSDIGKHLYFLVLLSYTHFHKVIEMPRYDLEHRIRCAFSCPKRKVDWVHLASNSDGEIYSSFDRKIVRAKLINYTGREASTYQVQQAAQQFLSAQYALSKESIAGDLHHLQGDNPGQNDEGIVGKLEEIIFDGRSYSTDDWKLLLELLPDVRTSEDITFQKVKTWMERSHSRCRFLANTLISEREVMKCLNNVISGLIFGVTFILWLLLTRLASTNVLVLIASPLLAATFVFGDTCKSLFQGLIFVYVVHPFDVGDLCVIDDKLLEVKRIDVWSTTFSNVRSIGKQQEIIYPNVDIAAKNLINHKTEFDWNDYLEFSLNSSDKKTTKIVKEEIEMYLDTEKERFTPNFHSVEFLEIGDDDKVAVHFRHNVQTEGWTYFECLKKKEKRRFEFALYVRNLRSTQKPKTETTVPALAEMDQEVTKDD